MPLGAYTTSRQSYTLPCTAAKQLSCSDCIPLMALGFRVRGLGFRGFRGFRVLRV